MENNHVKMLFRFYSKVLEEETVETMWAIIIDQKKGLYKIANIPFYVPSIATDDIILAEYDNDEEILTYRNTIEFSDNSTIRVIIIDKSQEINTIRDLFKKLDCPSESLSSSYFAMEIPAIVDYKTIKEILYNLEQKETISYEESCLSGKHKNEIL